MESAIYLPCGKYVKSRNPSIGKMKFLAPLLAVKVAKISMEQNITKQTFQKEFQCGQNMNLEIWRQANELHCNPQL